MRTSIETINGKQYTVVWYDALGHMGKPHWIRCREGFTGISCLDYDCIATALPALTRYPKPEDARLLYRYMAEGIEVQYSFDGVKSSLGFNHLIKHIECGRCNVEITHAATENGERVEVAINEGDV